MTERSAKEIVYEQRKARICRKKVEFAVQAKELRHEIRSYLGIKTVTNVRVLIRYDVENLSEDTFEKACSGIFAEPPVDVLYQECFPMAEEDHVFSVEFLPGQFDQRADSAEQCVKLVKRGGDSIDPHSRDLCD